MNILLLCSFIAIGNSLFVTILVNKVLLIIILLFKQPLATARAASCIKPVRLLVCLSVAKLQKRDFLKN